MSGEDKDEIDVRVTLPAPAPAPPVNGVVAATRAAAAVVGVVVVVVAAVTAAAAAAAGDVSVSLSQSTRNLSACAKKVAKCAGRGSTAPALNCATASSMTPEASSA